MSARWVVRLGALAVVLVWFVVSGIGGPLVGKLSEVQQNDNASFLPAGAESTLVSDVAPKFTDSNALPFIVVMARDGGLKPSDTAAAKTYLDGVDGLHLDMPGDHTIGDFAVGPPPQPVPSQDGEALLAVVNLDADKASETFGDTNPLYETAVALRDSADATLPSGLQAHVTGPGGTLADFITAFSGIDGILLGVALVVVFVILLVVYRSPILPFAVLVSSVFGLAMAALVVYPLAKAGVLEVSGQSQGILFILVVGATTDYALLLVSRFREELHDQQESWAALTRAWRGSVEPIVASGATVILGLLCLLLSDLGSTAGLGPVGAFGIVGALLAALTFLPAVLLLFGRRIFWPVVPRVDHVHSEDKIGTRGVWGRVAGLVGSHPRRTWATTLLALLAVAVFLPTFRASGVSQSDLFLNEVDSVTGQKVLAAHFPAGSGSPIQVLTPESDQEAVIARLRQEDGVTDPYASPSPQAPAKVVDGQVLIQATLTTPADSPQASDVVQRLRSDLDEVSPDVLVGGTTATNLDVRNAAERDLRVIIPAILGVIFVVLALLLRSLVAPVLLVVANVVSFAATIGVSAIVFNHVLDFPGSDPSTPLYGFVFLVALGIDYSIFLMTRVREEAATRGSRTGVLVGLAVTGGVITSAGIVLASTFSALAVLPILFLVQVAFIVAFGVLLDTLVVRSLLVPALSYDAGAWVWWPSRLGQTSGGGVAAEERVLDEPYQPRHAGRESLLAGRFGRSGGA